MTISYFDYDHVRISYVCLGITLNLYFSAHNSGTRRPSTMILIPDRHLEPLSMQLCKGLKPAS